MGGAEKYLAKLNKHYPEERIIQYSNQELNDLQKLKEIVNKFIEASDYQNKLCQDENYPALSYYNTEIDLERLEQITRKFINDSGHISEKEVLKQKSFKYLYQGKSNW